jgi:hypothetical protein
VITVEARTSTSVLLPVGGLWTVEVRAESMPTIVITPPNGTPGDPVDMDQVDAYRSIPSSWRYRTETTLATPGRYVAHVATDTDALDFAVYAAGPTSGTGMPDADALAHYMRDGAASWEPEDLTDALAIEAAAQRARCRVGAVYPDDLRGALLRRAQRNLAMRNLPLAMPQGDADSGPSILPGNDPEVRRLEAPYRKLVFG